MSTTLLKQRKQLSDLKNPINSYIKNILGNCWFKSRGKKLTIFAALLGFSCTSLAQQQQAEVNLSSTVIGNQEQPKVLYIVPWKPVGDSELEDQTIESQLDIVFGHVERVELRRELKYTDELEKKAKKAEQKK